LRIALFSPDDRWVTAGSNQGTVAIWDARSGAQVGPPLRAGDGAVNGVFDPADPTRFFTVSTTAVIRWDIHDHGHPVRVGEPLSFPAEPSGLSVIQISPDGRRIAAAGYINAQTRVWDAASGAVVSPAMTVSCSSTRRREPNGVKR
jgi:WD40 repeat protein